MPVTKIISGAQTGADRAGLDAAKEIGLETGGYVPKDRRTDEGQLTEQQMAYYGLTEHSALGYPPRTLANVLASDGTVLFGNVQSPGTRLTISYCARHKKPFIINPTPQGLKAWAETLSIETLNVAGNRERTNKGIYKRTMDTVVDAFKPEAE